jgi:hypothetical protein
LLRVRRGDLETLDSHRAPLDIALADEDDAREVVREVADSHGWRA